MAKSKKQQELETKVEELTTDLQRTRADFENYRKRVEQEKQAARAIGKRQAILGLLPVIDNIERAISHLPNDLADHKWALGVAGLMKGLDKTLSSLGLERIEAEPGAVFNPELHEAVQMDEESDGDQEVIADILQPGYTLEGAVVRHAMVKVTRK